MNAEVPCHCVHHAGLPIYYVARVEITERDMYVQGGLHNVMRELANLGKAVFHDVVAPGHVCCTTWYSGPGAPVWRTVSMVQIVYVEVSHAP